VPTGSRVRPATWAEHLLDPRPHNDVLVVFDNSGASRRMWFSFGGREAAAGEGTHVLLFTDNLGCCAGGRRWARSRLFRYAPPRPSSWESFAALSGPVGRRSFARTGMRKRWKDSKRAHGKALNCLRAHLSDEEFSAMISEPIALVCTCEIAPSALRGKGFPRHRFVGPG